MKVLICIFACLTYANALFFGPDHFGSKINRLNGQPLPLQPHPLPYHPHPPARPAIQIIRVIHQQSSVPPLPPNAPPPSLIRDGAPPRIIKVIHQQPSLQQSNIPLRESAATHVIKLIHLQGPSIAAPPPSTALPTNVIHVIHTHAPIVSETGSVPSASTSNPVPSLGYSYQQLPKINYTPQTAFSTTSGAYIPPISVQNNSPAPAVHVPRVDYSKPCNPPAPKDHTTAAPYDILRTPLSNIAPVYGPPAQKL